MIIKYPCLGYFTRLFSPAFFLLLLPQIRTLLVSKANNRFHKKQRNKLIINQITVWHLFGGIHLRSLIKYQ